MSSVTHKRPWPASISVIVPVRNGADTVSQQLAALTLQNYDGDWEVLLVDNGSSDHTKSLAGLWKPRLRQLSILDARERSGSSFARNYGAAHAKGDFLAFCDADDVVVPDWLASLASAARDFDAVTGRQEATDINSEAVQSWRPPRRTNLQGSRGFMPYAPSNNLGVWKRVFFEAGGFNEDYPQSHDVEWSWRAQLASFSVGFAEGAVVHYRYRASVRGVAKQAFLTGVDSARLYRDFRGFGMQRTPWSRVIRTWAWLPSHLFYVLSAPRRGVWVRRTGEAAGRLAGSWQFHVLFL